MKSKDSMRIYSAGTFVLSGRDRTGDDVRGEVVLARSASAPAELVGLTRGWLKEGFRDRPGNTQRPSRFFNFGTKSFQAVASRPIELPAWSGDTRSTFCVLAWQGRVGTGGAESVKESLDRNLPDVLRAYDDDDDAALEWSLSEVLYGLSIVRERYIARQRTYLAIVAAYVIVGLIAALASLRLLSA